jgi:hypothetical protein
MPRFPPSLLRKPTTSVFFLFWLLLPRFGSSLLPIVFPKMGLLKGRPETSIMVLLDTHSKRF